MCTIPSIGLVRMEVSGVAWDISFSNFITQCIVSEFTGSLGRALPWAIYWHLYGRSHSLKLLGLGNNECELYQLIHLWATSGPLGTHEGHNSHSHSLQRTLRFLERFDLCEASKNLLNSDFVICQQVSIL